MDIDPLNIPIKIEDGITERIDNILIGISKNFEKLDTVVSNPIKNLSKSLEMLNNNFNNLNLVSNLVGSETEPMTIAERDIMMTNNFINQNTQPNNLNLNRESNVQSNIEVEKLNNINKNVGSAVMMSMMDNTQFNQLMTVLERNSSILTDVMTKNQPITQKEVAQTTPLVNVTPQLSNTTEDKKTTKDPTTIMIQKLDVMIGALRKLGVWVDEQRSSKPTLRY
jgi:hypothetical protein